MLSIVWADEARADMIRQLLDEYVAQHKRV